MNITELSWRDSLQCKITGFNDKGCFVKIIGLNENFVGRIFDVFLPVSTTVFTTVKRIYKDYLILELESVDYSNNSNFAA